MIDIHFEVGGKRIKPDDIGDAISRMMVEHIQEQIRESIGSIRDPVTGEFPTIVMRGEDLANLHIHVEGSPELIAIVTNRLEAEEEDMSDLVEVEGPPKVFLSYTADDAGLAERIAKALQANGIDTWWDRWCISAGDSLRQKIDEGLRGCTHFVVLLTSTSVAKPWVNQEMDAGLIRKLNDECRFLPVRYDLPASDLPPLLAGMHAPEIVGDDDITQLINDIHLVSRKPKLGPSPHAVATNETTTTGYSAGANALARFYVENSKHGCFGDPRADEASLMEATGLTRDDLSDAVFELSAFFKGRDQDPLVKASLFTEFDRHWMPWDPREDAIKLAADIMNDETFPAACEEVAEYYGWAQRRLNPAVVYLHERGILMDYRALGHPGYELFKIVGKVDELRRFLKAKQ